MAHKVLRKHIIQTKPKGPESELYRKSQRQGLGIKFGLSDEALEQLGYHHVLGRLQKGLFVFSVCTAMIPFWFLLERKRFAQRAVPALAAFLLNLAAWGAAAYGIWYWLHRT